MNLRVVAQLIRLPNLPSALADICLAGFALSAHATSVSEPNPFPVVRFILLLLTSACLYSAGMVWNDYFDQEQDKQERPTRPLPSGQATPTEAIMLGVGLFVAALIMAWFAGRSSFILCWMLIGAIFLYDGWLKRTAFGPVAMGLCRFLNVMLGLSLFGNVGESWHFHLAGVVGLYIVGVTWFAKTEARMSNRNALQGAAVLIGASLLFALPLPLQRTLPQSTLLFPYLLVAFGFFLGIPIVQAIHSPTPSYVQAAVKNCLMGLIILDALLASALIGLVGLLIVLLIIPSMYLRKMRWLYAT